jgi:phenylpropionate dioxygenase-like ring-hydroxylating dioxygenase large terminal subunit
VNVVVSSARDSASASSSASSSVIDESENDTTLPSPPPDDPQLGAWMPLGSASSLTGLTPVQIRVCGVDIAVWHKPLPRGAKKRDSVATEWSALVDACPHRLAPLSQGRVDPNSGCIECPYHGWAFDSDGTLQSIPQLDEGRTIKAATGNSGGATSLPVHAAGDLLFVFLPTDITGESWP